MRFIWWYIYEDIFCVWVRQVLKQVFDATLKNSSFNLAESSKKWGHPWFHIYQHFTVSAFWARFQEWFSPLTAQAGVSRSIPGWIIRRQEIQPDKPTIGLQCTLNWSVCCLLVYKQSVQQRNLSLGREVVLFYFKWTVELQSCLQMLILILSKKWHLSAYLKAPSSP